MSGLQLGMVPGPIERVLVDLAVVTFFEDERPLLLGVRARDRLGMPNLRTVDTPAPSLQLVKPVVQEAVQTFRRLGRQPAQGHPLHGGIVHRL